MYDIRRSGLIPNRTAAATDNTNALRKLLSPVGGELPAAIAFPNTTGSDVYHFDGVVPVRDGVEIDLQDCTLSLNGSARPGDANSGLLFALRAFTLRNGTLNVAIDTSAAPSSGYAIQIGGRGKDSGYFTVWESQLTAPLGNVRLSNLRINLRNRGSNLASSGGIQILGGAHDVTLENITIDGGGTAYFGVYYEFGWASDAPPGTARASTHAQNMQILNLSVANVDSRRGIGLVLAGVHDCRVDGLKVSGAGSVFSGTPGEALFYNPWMPPQRKGGERVVRLHNLSGTRLGSTGIGLTGAQAASGGYLSSVIKRLGHPADYQAQTDLANYVLDGFELQGAPDAYGIVMSAASAPVRNGTLAGFQRGIVMTDEQVQIDLDYVKVLDCAQVGITTAGGAGIWPTARPKVGSIRNCLLAGNSTSRPNAFAGIYITNTARLLIEDCRLNYEAAHDGTDETTQGDAILLGAGAGGVICRRNYVGKVLDGSYAYHNLGGDPNSNVIQDARGNTSHAGGWKIE